MSALQTARAARKRNPSSEAEIAGSMRTHDRGHGEIVNVRFCDCPAEAMKFHSQFFDESDDVLRRWNNDRESHREILRGRR